jgi:predicted CXXCH cytochrome family protein
VNVYSNAARENYKELLHATFIIKSLIVGGFVALLLCGSVATADARKDQDSEEEKHCLDCHEDMHKRFSGDVKHKPFDDKDCYACHQFHGFRNVMELQVRVFDTCTGCHEGALDVTEDEAHDPLTDEKSCVVCHSPHRSDHPALLLMPLKDLCVDCHDSPAEAEGVVHKPYAESSCTTCHDPHGSIFSSHLKLPAGLICIDCHVDHLENYAPPEMHSGNDMNSCDNCHEGHYSEFDHLLRREGSGLCLGCHEDLKDVADREWPHDAVADGECLDCHQPHFRKGTSSLISAQAGLCGDCHDLEDEDFLGKHLGLSPVDCAGCHDPHGGAVEVLMRPFLHSPFEDGDCDNCHEDGGDPAELRSPELCEMCHDEVEPVGGHAPEKVEKRVCVDCHSPHAARVEFLLR